VAGVASFTTSSLPSTGVLTKSVGHAPQALFEGDDQFGASTSSAVIVQVRALVSVRGDINGDGKADLMWRHTSIANAVALWFMAGTADPVGAFLPYPVPPYVQDSCYPTSVNDVDFDGKSDFVGECGSYRDYFFGLDGASVRFMVGAPTGDWSTPVSTADFDGDKLSDVMYLHTYGDAWYALRTTVLDDSSIGYYFGGPNSSPRGLPAGWVFVATGDFNGDGSADVIWRNALTGETLIQMLTVTTKVGWNGTTIRNFAAAYHYLPWVDGTWSVAGVGDWNGDARVDLFWRNELSGANALWIMNGGTAMGTAMMPTVHDTQWKIATWGDYDGDEKCDLFWRHAVTGDNAVWLMNGSAAPLGVTMPPVYDPLWKPIRQ
jgi:hypothetical protein